MKSFLFLYTCSISILFALNPSPNPPGNLKPSQVPQFIFIGSDDQSVSPQELADLFSEFKNPSGNGISATYDNNQAHISFYSNSTYRNLDAHVKAHSQGHEIGNHTHEHLQMGDYEKNIESIQSNEAYFLTETLEHYKYFTTKVEYEIDGEVVLVNVKDSTLVPAQKGIPKEDFTGFRIPYLHTTNAAFDAIATSGYEYDCSLEDGFQENKTASNMNWPYTLKNPNQDIWQLSLDTKRDSLPLKSYPNLWEIPVYPLVTPKGKDGLQYGLPIDFRYRLAQKQQCKADTTCTMPPEDIYSSEKDTTSVKITGFDYNAYFIHKLNNQELLALLKYNLTQKYNGNRAPLTYGIHAKNYSSFDAQDNQQMLRDFLTYAVTLPDVRIVTGAEIIKWMKQPVSLEGKVVSNYSAPVEYPFIIKDRLLHFTKNLSGKVQILNSKGQILETHSLLSKSIFLPLGNYYLKHSNKRRITYWKL